MQAAIARRPTLPCSVAAAIAEVGIAEACLILIENPGADLAPFSLDRIVERFGHLAAIREALFARDDLPAADAAGAGRQASETLAGFVVARHWLDEDARAAHRAGSLREGDCHARRRHAAAREVRPLIRHLRETGQLTAGLILRALLSGNMALFEEALAELAGPAARARQRAGARPARRRLPRRVRQGRPAGLDLSGVPRRDRGDARGRLRGDPGGARGSSAAWSSACSRAAATMLGGEIEPLMTLLRRFATEAAREEARLFCDELVDAEMRRSHRGDYAVARSAAA